MAYDIGADCRLAYVAVPRGRYDAQLCTNDKGHLTEQLSRDVSHRTAMELPAAGVYVVAIPEAPLRDEKWKYRAEVTDQNGRFLLRGRLPGEYRVFSWDSADDFDWYDAEQLKPYEGRGVPISVQEGDRKTLQLNVIETQKATQEKQ